VKHLISVAAALSVLAPFATAAEVVTTRERAFVVRYTDSTTERYAVKWILDVAASSREQGGAFVPYQGAVENRRCAWSVDTSVERKVSLVTRLGEPIPVAKLSRLFQPFSRSLSDGPGSGLGLGLYIASEIARAHGGDLQVTSTREEGTRFVFRMPGR